MALAGISSNVSAMTEKEAANNFLFFNTTEEENKYCENILHIQTRPAYQNWLKQNGDVFSRSLKTLEQYFMSQKGVTKDEATIAIGGFVQRLADVDKEKLAKTRNEKTCMKFAESLKFYESQLRR